MNPTLFQYCPKLAVFSNDGNELLMCRRKGELDYDGTFSLIGGKMEHGDSSIVEAIRREKNEEVGFDFKVRILPHYSIDVLFTKTDGQHMILPHHYGEYIAGSICLSEEYSESIWVKLDELSDFEPMVKNIRWIAPRLKRIRSHVASDELLAI